MFQLKDKAGAIFLQAMFDTTVYTFKFNIQNTSRSDPSSCLSEQQMLRLWLGILADHEDEKGNK